MEHRDSLSVDEQRRVHELCWQFEEDWRNGSTPLIENFLSRVTPKLRADLLRELIEMELELRFSAGDPGTVQGEGGHGNTASVAMEDTFEFVSELTRRFPDDRPLVSSTVERFKSLRPSGAQAVPQDSRYEFLHEIDRGGAGVVWRVYDRHLKRQAAVKLLLDSQNNTEMRLRLEQEARLCGRLQHPGIVPVHELSKLEDGRPFMTMKLVEGRTLAQLLDARPAEDQATLLQATLRACEAIAYAHERGVIHRDLKPGNIIVSEFNEVQVMDWGLGKDLSAANEETLLMTPVDFRADANVHTLSGTVFGTPGYMPPEQARGHIESIGRQSDVFSLGAILCRILTGAAPYVADNSEQVLQMAAAADLSEAYQRLRRCGANAKLVALVRQCLAEDPAQRPADAGLLVKQLRPLLSPHPRRRRTMIALCCLVVCVAVAGRLVISRSSLISVTKEFDKPHAEAAEDLSQSIIADAQAFPVAASVRDRSADPHVVRLKDRAEFGRHLDLVVAELRVARYPEAEALCHQLIAADNTDPLPHLHLAHALYNQGRFEEATDSAESGIQRLPQNYPDMPLARDRLAKYRRAQELYVQREQFLAKAPADVSLDDVAVLAEACSLSGEVESSLQFHRMQLAHPDLSREKLNIERAQAIIYFVSHHLEERGLPSGVRTQLVEFGVELLTATLNDATVRQQSHGKDDKEACFHLKVIEDSRKSPGLLGVIDAQDITPELRDRLTQIWQDAQRISTP